jgi:hypothetical protein
VISASRPSEEDRTTIQPKDVIGCSDVVTVVSDADDGNAPFGFFGKDFADTTLALVVESGGGFVEDEDLGAASEPLGEQHSLTLAAGEIGERAVLEALHPHPGDRAFCRSGAVSCCPRTPPVPAVAPGSHRDHVTDCEAERLRCRWPLDDECDVGGAFDDPSTRAADASEQFYEGRFSGAVRTGHRGDRTPRHVQAHPLEDVVATEGVVKALCSDR